LVNVEKLFDSLGLDQPVTDRIPNSGKIRTISGKEYFLKTGELSDTYRCEANGLRELSKSGAIRIAEVISVGNNYILTQYIEHGRASGDFHREFGRNLARMHRYSSTQFGFYEDNYIGANPQLNIPDETEKTDWIAFYFNKRLLFQYKIVERNGYITERLKSGFSRLEKNIYPLLKNSLEPPSLLHGDLWSGNYLCDADQQAVLIDPAVYYGHREADLAMTKVFGGFSPDFYRGYMEECPLSDGWERREGIYKLYHILNHLNLFGRSYLGEAEYIVSGYYEI